MDSSDVLSLNTSASDRPSPKTARYRFPLEDGLERLFRKEEKERTAKFHFTDQDGLCQTGESILRRREGYEKFLLRMTQYPFFVQADGPMHGLTGVVRKASGLERKVLLSPTQVPDHAIELLAKQTEEAGTKPIQIFTYDTEKDGMYETRLFLQDQRFDALQEELKNYKEVEIGNLKRRVEDAGKSYQYHALKNKTLLAVFSLVNPGEALSAIATYINDSTIPLKLLVTNEGKAGGISAEIIFVNGLTWDVKYQDKRRTLHGDEAIEEFLLLPYELRYEGRLELYSMQYGTVDLDPTKNITRKLSVNSLLLDSARKLDESSDDLPVYRPSSE